MKKLLITGSSGFVGQHILNYLKKSNYEIHATYRSKEPHISQSSANLNFYKLDLLNSDEITTLVNKINPESVIHLAGASSPSESFKNPNHTLTTNIISELNLLEAIRNINYKECKILIISTGEIYGSVNPSDLPIKETAQLNPMSPYSVSKITQEYLALQYYNSYQIKSVIARPFNHIGPAQSSQFVVSNFANQIARIEKNIQQPIIKVGNLMAKRDFTDVRDISKAYHLLLEKGKPGEIYNLGTGKSRSIKEILDILLSFSKHHISVEVDPSRYLPVDIADLYCDHQKITILTGWQPEIPLDKTLKDTLDYWRSIV